jgi:cysteinyl-tRNA synthetase
MLHSYEAAFLKAINDDLNMPQALAVAWKAARNASLPHALRKALLATFDKVLGLGLKEGMERKVPAQILALARQRDKFRANKQFMQADALRKSLKELGYEVEDTAKGPVLTKTANA